MEFYLIFCDILVSLSVFRCLAFVQSFIIIMFSWFWIVESLNRSTHALLFGFFSFCFRFATRSKRKLFFLVFAVFRCSSFYLLALRSFVIRSFWHTYWILCVEYTDTGRQTHRNDWNWKIIFNYLVSLFGCRIFLSVRSVRRLFTSWCLRCLPKLSISFDVACVLLWWYICLCVRVSVFGVA